MLPETKHDWSRFSKCRHAKMSKYCNCRPRFTRLVLGLMGSEFISDINGSLHTDCGGKPVAVMLLMQINVTQCMVDINIHDKSASVVRPQWHIQPRGRLWMICVVKFCRTGGGAFYHSSIESDNHTVLQCGMWRHLQLARPSPLLGHQMLTLLPPGRRNRNIKRLRTLNYQFIGYTDRYIPIIIRVMSILWDYK